jgi:DNA-binding NarL/FixJ family response regulator
MILFVDDEQRRVAAFVAELEQCFDVRYIPEVDEALSFFEENLASVELLILDIMMPAGRVFRDVDTQYGLMTGVYFYDKIRERAPDMPVIIFTNVTNEQLSKRFNEESNCLFLKKKDYLPHELVTEVRGALLPVF